MARFDCSCHVMKIENEDLATGLKVCHCKKQRESKCDCYCCPQDVPARLLSKLLLFSILQLFFPGVVRRLVICPMLPPDPSELLHCKTWLQNLNEGWRSAYLLLRWDPSTSIFIRLGWRCHSFQ